MIAGSTWEWIVTTPPVYAAFLVFCLWFGAGMVALMTALPKENDLGTTPEGVVRWWVKWTIWVGPLSVYWIIIGIIWLVREAEEGVREAFFMEKEK